MDRREKLLNYMTEHKDEYLGILEKAVRLETPTEGDREDLDKCRAFFADLFRGIGCRVTEVESLDPRFADGIRIEFGNPDGRQLLFGGHYDTVHEKCLFAKEFGDTWHVEGGKAIGPGVLDMKSGDCMVYMAMKAIKELNLLPDNANITFFLTGDEEAGSYGASKRYMEYAKESIAAFIMESSAGIVGVDHDYIGGVKSGRYGRGNYTFHAHGTPYHSGLNPTLAESGLIELSKQAVALEEMTFFDRVNSETGKPETVTVGCTCLDSGNAGWPTVPGDGALTIDARFSTVQLAEEYDAKFRNMKSFNPKVPITTTGGLEKPPFDKDLPGNKHLQELAVRLGGEFGVEIRHGMVRGGSDGNFTSAAGCPTLDGLGATGSHIHQLGEYVNIDQLPFRMAFVTELALRVLSE